MDNSLKLCEACGDGHLHPTASNKAAEYNGVSRHVVMHYAVCDLCKAELINAEDSLKNKREWIRFKKSVDHIPLGAEIVTMRKRHGLSQALAAAIFGGGPVAFSKYENDDLIPDEAMVGLLKLAITYPDTVRQLAQLKGIELPVQKLPVDKTQFEISMPRRQLGPFSTPANRTPQSPQRRYDLLRKKAASQGKKAKTVSRSSEKLIRKILHGGSSWTVQ